MPVFVPYMTSLAASFCSSIARHAVMRSSASGARATGSPSRAMRTSASVVRL